MGRDTKVNVSSVWKTLTKVAVNVSGVWKDVYKIYARTGGVWEEVFIKPVTIIVSADADEVDLFTAFSSPSLPAQFIYIINSGIIVGSADPVNPAITVPDSFPAESEILIINNGQIIGCGGFGGQGGDDPDNTGLTEGEDGGNSIDISRDISIDNTNGDIFGGGGGGGGGGEEGCNSSAYAGGGGGGGGAGDNFGLGGLGGTVSFGTDPEDGADGSTVGGAGGAGGIGIALLGGDGGDGGGYGEAGNTGQDGQDAGTCEDFPGAAGGAAGKAVDLSSNVVTWLGGNNPTQVKGAVS